MAEITSLHKHLWLALRISGDDYILSGFACGAELGKTATGESIICKAERDATEQESIAFQHGYNYAITLMRHQLIAMAQNFRKERNV